MTKLMANFNGFINSCGARNLSSEVAVRGPESVVLRWQAWQPAEELIGYAVFVTRAPYRNVSEYAGPKLCHSSADSGAGFDVDLDDAHRGGREDGGWVVHDVRFDPGQ